MYSELKDSIETIISSLEKEQQHIKQELTGLPDGKLKIIQRHSGETNYYHYHYIDGERHIDYIPKKKNLKLAYDLAKAQYYKELDKELNTQLELLNNFNEKFAPEKLEDAFYQLSPARRNLITPVFQTSEEYAKEWDSAVYDKNSYYPENLIFETDKGDMVRSKSEVIIANYLHAQRDKVFYRYECSLYLDNPRPITIHPDFTIMSRKTGKIVYLEHCGMLDNEQYANDFVKKMNTYIANNIIPGKDIIFTAETSTTPLVIQSLWAQIESILQTNLLFTRRIPQQSSIQPAYTPMLVYSADLHGQIRP